MQNLFMMGFGGAMIGLVCKNRSIILRQRYRARVIKLLKGNVISLGKESKNSLYDENKASFEKRRILKSRHGGLYKREYSKI